MYSTGGSFGVVEEVIDLAGDVIDIGGKLFGRAPRDTTPSQWSGEVCPGQPTEAAALLLERISDSDAAALISVTPDESTANAIRTRNPEWLAWHVAGGFDCRTTSSRGKEFVAAFNRLVQKYADQSGGQLVRTTPGAGSDEGFIDLASPYAQASISPAVLAVAALAFFALSRGGRR